MTAESSDGARSKERPSEQDVDDRLPKDPWGWHVDHRSSKDPWGETTWVQDLRPLLPLIVAIVLTMLIFAFPTYPKTLTGWVVFFGLGLLVTCGVLALPVVIGESRPAQRLKERFPRQSRIWLHSVYTLLATLLILALVQGVAPLLGIFGAR
jgi:hypothetical protein